MDEGSHEEACEDKSIEAGILRASGFAESHFKDLFKRESPSPDLVLISSLVPSADYNNLGMCLEGYRQTGLSDFSKITPLSELYDLSGKSGFMMVAALCLLWLFDTDRMGFHTAFNEPLCFKGPFIQRCYP